MSKSPSLRRIQADVRELALEPSDRYHAAPLEDDMFEWHFTIRGPEGTEFEGGYYHGRILLPPEYPFKPPHIIFTTPSGRFETHTKICLSFTAYHQELWQPAWGIRLILEALISFLPTPADGAIGALDWTKEERRRVAKESKNYTSEKCGGRRLCELIPKIENDNDGAIKKEKRKSSYQKEIEMLKMFQVKNEQKNAMMKQQQKEQKKCDAYCTEKRQQDNEEKKKDEEVNATIAVSTTSIDSNTEVVKNSSDQSKKYNNQERQASITTTNTATSSSSSWISDPLIHGSILTFAAISFLLYRKIETLLTELEKLDE